MEQKNNVVRGIQTLTKLHVGIIKCVGHLSAWSGCTFTCGLDEISKRGTWKYLVVIFLLFLFSFYFFLFFLFLFEELFLDVQNGISKGHTTCRVSGKSEDELSKIQRGPNRFFKSLEIGTNHSFFSTISRHSQQLLAHLSLS